MRMNQPRQISANAPWHFYLSRPISDFYSRFITTHARYWGKAIRNLMSSSRLQYPEAHKFMSGSLLSDMKKELLSDFSFGCM